MKMKLYFGNYVPSLFNGARPFQPPPYWMFIVYFKDIWKSQLKSITQVRYFLHRHFHFLPTILAAQASLRFQHRPPGGKKILNIASRDIKHCWFEKRLKKHTRDHVIDSGILDNGHCWWTFQMFGHLTH